MTPGQASIGFCANTAGLWQFAGYAVMILKILIPVILIIWGIIALGKAVIADDDKEVKTAVTSLIKRFIAAVVIFFIPSIIKALFFTINGFDDVQDDIEVCVNCVVSPNKDCPVK